MVKLTLVGLICFIGLASALPLSATKDETQAKYDPRSQNVYHLFTRRNPSVSQPLVIHNEFLVSITNFNANRRTVVILHDWLGSIVSDVNNVLIPAFLAAEDVNVIAVDWSVGAGSINIYTAAENTVTSGVEVAEFLNWLNRVTNSFPIQYHIVGHGLGGHQAGIVARNMVGQVAYVTALDPSLLGWLDNEERFRPTDALYTEVIHTNTGVNGYVSDIGDVDFYPNGGAYMPGCDSHGCHHDRAIFYFAESITSGGFTGQQCVNYLAAYLNTCNVLPGRLQMGGLRPKTGSSGVFVVPTNAGQPFSQG